MGRRLKVFVVTNIHPFILQYTIGSEIMYFSSSVYWSAKCLFKDRQSVQMKSLLDNIPQSPARISFLSVQLGKFIYQLNVSSQVLKVESVFLMN